MMYRYTGPQTAMTLGDGRELVLLPGHVVDLPEGADVTQTLIALGRLSPETAPVPRKPRTDKE